MSEDLKYWFLRDHRLFQVLNNAQIKQLCVISNFKQAQKGEIIDLSEHESVRLFFLNKGNVKLVEIDEHGNEFIKEILLKGDIFGALNLDMPTGSHEYAQILTDKVIICSFKTSDFEQLLAQNPQLAISYTKMVGWQFRRFRNQYSNLFFKTAKQRLLLFLHNWIEQEGKMTDGLIVLQNYLTQKEISQVICTSRQTATQLLSELETNGIIQYNRKEIVVLKPETIKVLAKKK